MKNTGITYTSTERSPVILPEMAELLPPLSAEQSAALEEDLVRNGCCSPIIVNEDMVIVDGHNRQSLCEKQRKRGAMSKTNSLRCPLCGKGRIADIPSGAEQSQYRLFALHRAEHPDLIAKCPKCGEQIGITVLTPDAHPLIHTPIPFMGYVQA